MASEFLDPTSNVNALWTPNEYTLIDDGTRQPSVPATDKIVADDGDDNEEQSYGMSDPTASYSEITSIVVWAYGTVSHPALNNALDCRIKVDGVYETQQEVGFTSDGLTWESITFNGSWTEAEVDNLEVSFITPSIGKDDTIEIHSMYVDMTGTLSAPAGVTRKIKISGTFQDKPIKTKVGGTFVDKPIKIKVGGTFQDA